MVKQTIFDRQTIWYSFTIDIKQWVQFLWVSLFSFLTINAFVFQMFAKKTKL